MTNFSDLNLAEAVAKVLTTEGYTTPTPIQTQAIPLVMEGRDLLGIAQTGTGKTAAFALPILDRLARNPKRLPRRGARVLILAPTRELAGQIATSFTTYGQCLRLNVVPVFGGAPINRQMRQMERGADILVATPGRLLDLIDRRAITLADVEVLVLDEADQMLDLGFVQPLRKIVPMLPADRQTLFFSATMPKAIASLAKSFLTDPARVSVAPASSTAERVEQRAIFVNQSEKQALLTIILRQPEVERALVFTRTKHGADRVVRLLAAAGIKSAAIHGNKSQSQRERALKAFRAGQCDVLIATDIAARGIHVEGVSHVINFEIPNVPEQYVHRIGRTARAGKAGIALSFVAKDEKPFMRDISRLTRLKMPVQQLPENFTEECAKIKALRPAPAEAKPARSGPKRRGRAKPSTDKRREGKRPEGKRQDGQRPEGKRPIGKRPAGKGGNRPGKRARQAMARAEAKG